jgi:hypothetical protein
MRNLCFVSFWTRRYLFVGNLCVVLVWAHRSICMRNLCFVLFWTRRSLFMGNLCIVLVWTHRSICIRNLCVVTFWTQVLIYGQLVGCIDLDTPVHMHAQCVRCNVLDTQVLIQNWTHLSIGPLVLHFRWLIRPTLLLVQHSYVHVGTVRQTPRLFVRLRAKQFA